MKLVPKGTSSYQAAWILENEEEEVEDEEVTDDDSEEDDSDMEAEKESEVEEDVEEDDEENEMEEMSEDKSQSNLDRAEVAKYREERDNVQWPDEVGPVPLSTTNED